MSEATTPDDAAAAALIRQVIALDAEGRAGEAVSLAVRLLDIDPAVFASADVQLARDLVEAGARLRGRGAFDVAVQLLGKGLRAIQEHPLGRPADLLVGLMNLTALYDQIGDRESCSRTASYIVHLAERIEEPVSPGAAQVLGELADLYERSGQYRAAATLLTLLDRTLEATSGLPPDTHLYFLTRHAGVLSRAGDAAAARHVLERACALAEGSDQRDTETAGVAYNNLASAYLGASETERYPEAERLARHALSIARRAASGGVDLGVSIALVAQSVAVQGRSAEAEDLYAEAVAVFEAAPGMEPGDFAAYLADWGRVALDARRSADAVARLRRAIDVCASSGLPVPPDALSNLATAHFEEGALREAIPLYREALDRRHLWTATPE
jgi:tetratricopeptide (TPR) repeat protein